MTLRSKLVLPINMILVLVLGASLAWEWRRSEATELAVLHARLDEEARFIRAAHDSLGGSTRFADYLGAFCHATDAAASPDHQVALVDGGSLIAEAAVHARQPMDPLELAGLGEGAWLRRRGQESYLVRVSDQEGRKVVVAESTRALRARVRARILTMAGWYLGLGVVLLAAVNALMRRTVLSPIRRLSRAVRRLEQGQLGVQVDAASGDELGALGRRFNAMSRVIAEQAEADRRELETARRVQAHLLPPSEFRLGLLEFAGRCTQAGPVGGDVYDVQPLPGDRVGILVADLSGHNVAAALHTAMVRAIVWREAEQAASPGEVLGRLNDRLCRDLPEEHFATAFFGWFEARSGRLYYANAGHPPAYLVSPRGSPRELGPTGPLLGVLPDVPHGSESVELEPGGALLAYTDGLPESMGQDGELWGSDEMLAVFRSGEADRPAQVVARLLDRAAAFRGPVSPQDDVTVIIAKRMPTTVDVGSTPE
ncbi:MAG: SpoIIE family protein phosphatase [Gemmatimonadales bacterium]|nr:SpoIIE family protein phosphatase [Gemmatimonadales bacterium]